MRIKTGVPRIEVGRHPRLIPRGCEVDQSRVSDFASEMTCRRYHSYSGLVAPDQVGPLKRSYILISGDVVPTRSEQVRSPFSPVPVQNDGPVTVSTYISLCYVHKFKIRFTRNGKKLRRDGTCDGEHRKVTCHVS